MTKNPQLAAGDPVPNGVCLNVDGEPVALDSLWAEGPIFLTFLRHFG